MSPSPTHDPIDGLNLVLSEVIEMVQVVKQTHAKISEAQALHTELDRLFNDLRIWSRLLIEQDDGLGVSPLASIPRFAGRSPGNLWAGTPPTRRPAGSSADISIGSNNTPQRPTKRRTIPGHEQPCRGAARTAHEQASPQRSLRIESTEIRKSKPALVVPLKNP
jgi:hypothetical protein